MLNAYSKYKGVLPDSVIKQLIADGSIAYADALNVGSSSLDTSLSGEGVRIPGSARPVEGQSVRDLIKRLRPSALTLNDPLERGGVYLLRLNEKINLPHNVYGYANPKSTTGRDDIHVRLIADGVGAYDTIPHGYKGELWLEVRPMSFFCQACCGLSLNQLRFFTADTRIKNSVDLLHMEKTEGPLIFQPDGTPIELDERLSADGSVQLSIFLQPDFVGYESRGTHELLDLSADGILDPNKFFIKKDMSDGFLFVQKDRFYILSSHERVRVPVDYACELRAVDDRLGEIRVHYAGYIDDGWGGDKGAQITLEVRTKEDTYLQVGQPIGRIVFERMARRADKPYTEKTSNYVGQVGPQLAKHFRKEEQ